MEHNNYRRRAVRTPRPLKGIQEDTPSESLADDMIGIFAKFFNGVFIFLLLYYTDFLNLEKAFEYFGTETESGTRQSYFASYFASRRRLEPTYEMMLGMALVFGLLSIQGEFVMRLILGFVFSKTFFVIIKFIFKVLIRFISTFIVTFIATLILNLMLQYFFGVPLPS